MTEKPALPDDLIAEIERLAPQLMGLDHYGVLSLHESATVEEVKAAYFRATKRFHPDRWAARDSTLHRKRMEAIFARATEAYQVLRDPESRLDYDRSLYAVRGIPRASSAPMPVSHPFSPPPSPPLPPAPLPPAPPASPARAPTREQIATAARLLMQRTRPASQTVPHALPVPAPAPAAPGKPRPRILVVEDDETLRKMILRVLSEIGDCDGAADGAIALGMVQAGPIPALVVTDVMMPNMDGLELARRLKKDPITHRIPIVMLTAKTGPKDTVDGVNAGARYYVTKPFKVDELRARVKKALGIP